MSDLAVYGLPRCPDGRYVWKVWLKLLFVSSYSAMTLSGSACAVTVTVTPGRDAVCADPDHRKRKNHHPPP